MRVCLDASSLTFPPSGVRTYVDALITELRRLTDEIELSVVNLESDGPAIAQRVPQRLARFWWDAWGVGSAANRNGAELLHVPQFSSPLRTTVPLVVTIHDLIPLKLPEYRHSLAMRGYMDVMRRTVRKAAVVIVPSEYVAAAVPQLLDIDRCRIWVIPMAANPVFTPAVDHESVPDGLRQLGINGPYVFNIAGFDVRKNLPCLLEAFALFCKDADTPHKLVIAGAPHSDNLVVFPPVAPIIERLGLSGQVILPGLVSEATKVALYQHAAMYVTPSLEEGFGMTCLEAMSCGIPTIAANRASLPEVVETGGLLVEPEPDAVAAAMLSVLQDPRLAGELRGRALARSERFSWADTARQTIEAYREALET